MGSSEIKLITTTSTYHNYKLIHEDITLMQLRYNSDTFKYTSFYMHNYKHISSKSFVKQNHGICK